MSLHRYFRRYLLYMINASDRTWRLLQCPGICIDINGRLGQNKNADVFLVKRLHLTFKTEFYMQTIFFFSFMTIAAGFFLCGNLQTFCVVLSFSHWERLYLDRNIRPLYIFGTFCYYLNVISYKKCNFLLKASDTRFVFPFRCLTTNQTHLERQPIVPDVSSELVDWIN